MLEIYWAYNACFDERQLEEQYWNLSLCRRQKVDACSNTADKRERIVAGMLLERALCDRGYNPAAGYEVSSGGKPFLKAEKSGQEIGQFSLTHSKTISACVASSCAVGIDAEQLGRGTPSMAERFFCEREKEKLRQLTKENWDKMFTLCWTAKEAVKKCLDLPLSKICCDTDFSEIWEKMTKETCEIVVFDERTIYLRSFFVEDGVITCACGKDGLFSLKRIDK